ncbi:MAG: hypothetical protein IJW25_01275, partial [Clostridia bacterium]|nr:hypothetical protein [Clostridia bacterium]
MDAYSSENFKLYNQSLKKSLKEQSYYLDSSENSYSNYYEMLKEIGKNDLNSAKSYYQKINKDVENMLNTYSSTSYGDAPNGYINDNYNSYNTTMQQYWKTSLKVTYDDIYNIVYSKKPNADFMNSEIKIGTELDLFDLLPEDVQEWRYSYWGYGSESEYKNELKQQIVRVGLLEDAVDNLPKVGVITAYKVWAYGLQNATEEEKDDLEFIINSKTLNTIDYVRDSGDLAHYNKAFAPVGDFLNDVIDLHNHTFKDPNKSLESYYTAESKKLIKDKIKNIEAQYNKLKDKNYLDSIESSARALSDDVTYDYVYYVTEIYNFYKDHILT